MFSDDETKDVMKEADIRSAGLHPIWEAPQFMVRDVCAITGATPKAIEHFVSPKFGMVRLHGNWVNPGTGKRRMFTGAQVLMIQAAYVANKIGFPQKFSATLAETIERRAKNRWFGLNDGKENLAIISYPMKDKDDWALKIVFDGMTEEPQVPTAFHMLLADRLIDEVHTQLQAIVAGDEMPNFDVPDIPEPENPYGPKANFFLAWEKDEQGQWVYVGLNHDETKELLFLMGSKLEGDELVIVEPLRRTQNAHEAERYQLLFNRHEEARLHRIGEKSAQELAAKLAPS